MGTGKAGQTTSDPKRPAGPMPGPVQGKIGGKAASLQQLQAHGFAVPSFRLIRSGTSEEDLTRCLTEFTEPGTRYAIRSSASVEDSDDTAMAGLFETFLDVPPHEIPDRVEQCFASGGSRRVHDYLRARNIDWDGEMTVIVQRMVEPLVSGVLFTANPQGILNEMTAVLGFGTGDLVVEDRVPVATFIHSFHDEVDLFAEEPGAPEISRAMAAMLTATARALKDRFAVPMDAEFAFAEGRLWLLQARPITTLAASAITILDSSNISESYPGLTLPLSIDFAGAAYAGIFQSLISGRLGSSTAEGLKPVLQAMVASSSGRMYYRIDNWYRVMKLLPLSRLYIPVWQEMMGVSHREVPADGISVAPLSRFAGILRFARAFKNTSRDMDELDRNFQAYRQRFQAAMAEGPALPELEGLYLEMKETLLSQWDVTLLNDLHAFLYTGVLKKLMAGDPGVKPEAVLSRIGEVESMKPLVLFRRIALLAPPAFLSLGSDAEILHWLESGSEFAAIVNDYIDAYGDRYLEELKLESRTFRTDPRLLQDWIIRLREGSWDAEKSAAHEGSLEPRAEEAAFRGLTGWAYRRAVRGIRYRESSRLNRTRAFGMARAIFLEAGGILKAEGSLEEARDVFWLRLDEVFTDGATFRQKVQRRKALYEEYGRLPLLTRLVFAGEPFDRTLPGAGYRNSGELLLLGSGASPGVVRGRVLTVDSPDAADETAGRILVTRQTDPGWVFLITAAAGLIAEKGSFLSHTAIIARELGKPAVVGVKGAMSLFRDGELVEIDGATGEVRRLDHNGTV